MPLFTPFLWCEILQVRLQKNMQEIQHPNAMLSSISTIKDNLPQCIMAEKANVDKGRMDGWMCQ